MIPRVHKRILHRPRLVAKMRRELDLALTLISAPAGYGKTSLLVDLCDAIAYPVCWLSLDESDQDFGVFVLHLTQAIQHRYPGFGARILQAQEANPDLVNNLDALCNVFLQDLAENVSAYTVLVLDDYHLLDRSWKVGRLLGAMAQYAGRQWHVIVSSRTNPGNLPSIDLLADDLMAFVSQEDLAFNADEVQQVLQMRHNVNLTPEQAGELVALSEGWITGITLATNVMWRGIRDVLVQARAQEEQIYTYLANHAFNDLPAPLREKMLDSSTLEEMSVELCSRALGLQGLGQVLPEMERRGVFLTVREDEKGVEHYRYHHLLLDFLQNHLRQQNPGRFAQLHGQAAAYFEAQEQWYSAVAHRRAAGDEQATAQTMENGAKPMFLAGRLETLVAWYENVPSALRPEVPRLLLFAGRALSNLDRADEAIPLLHQAEHTFCQRGALRPRLAAMLQRATICYSQGRYTATLDIARESLDVQDSLESNLVDFTAEAFRLIGIACLNLGRPGEAVEHLQTALDLYQKLGRRETAATYLDLSFAHFRLGQLAEGWACQDKAIELLRQTAPSSLLAMTLNNVAYARYLAGNYGQVLPLLCEAQDIAQDVGSPRALAFAQLSAADLYRDLGAFQKSQGLYTQAEKLARQLGYADLLNFALAGAAQALLRVGDTVEALGLAAQARDQAQRRGDVYQLGLSCLTLGAALLQAGEHDRALDEIERGRQQLQHSGARRDLTRACALLARARQAAGDVEGALAALEQALDLGVETQTTHYLVVEGQQIFDLLKLLQQRRPADRRPANIMDRIWALPGVARQTIGALAPAQLYRPRLRFYGLGPGRVEKDGELVSAWRSVQARYLLFYLLAHPPRSRDQIADAFWPQAVSQRKIKSVFHWTKSQAHEAVGLPLIVHEEALYRVEWDPGYWFDARTFEELLDGRGEDRRQRLEEAVTLYQGDFLAGYDAPWCLPVRARLRARYLNALVELGELCAASHEFHKAFPALNQAVATDDVYEPAIQALMRLHTLNDRPSAALALFCQLEQRLSELEARPTRKTRLLYQSIQAGPSLARLGV